MRETGEITAVTRKSVIINCLQRLHISSKIAPRFQGTCVKLCSWRANVL